MRIVNAVLWVLLGIFVLWMLTTKTGNRCLRAMIETFTNLPW